MGTEVISDFALGTAAAAEVHAESVFGPIGETSALDHSDGQQWSSV